MQNDRVVERGIILAAILIILNFWSVRNTGQGFENYGVLTGGVGLITGIFALISWLTSDAEEESYSAAIREWLVRIFSFPLLAILGTAVGVLLMSTSSVLVLNDFGDIHPRILLVRADSLGSSSLKDNETANTAGDLEKAIKEAGCANRAPNQPQEKDTSQSEDIHSITELDRTKDDPYRYFVTTSPLGRLYRLEINGYQAKTLDVFPLWGPTVSPSRDLRHAPSVLFRPDLDALGELQQGGFVIIALFRNGRDKLLGCVANIRSSFLVGGMESVSLSNIQKFREEWRLELAEAKEDERHTAQTLLEWKNATHVPLMNVPNLEPQMTLRCEVRSRNHVPVARTTLTLTEEDLIDVPVNSLASGQKSLPSTASASSSR